jgi:hypothetical protein
MANVLVDNIMKIHNKFLLTIILVAGLLSTFYAETKFSLVELCKAGIAVEG